MLGKVCDEAGGFFGGLGGSAEDVFVGEFLFAGSSGGVGDAGQGGDAQSVLSSNKSLGDGTHANGVSA